MNASFMKRICSYIIDMVILGIVITASLMLFSNSNSNNIDKLNEEVNTINEELLSDEITLENYIFRYSTITSEIDKYMIIDNVLNIIYIILLFIYIPFFIKGQTLGMKITKIKIVKEDGQVPLLNDYLFRAILIYGLGYLIISLAFVYILPSFSYFCLSSILIILEFLLVFISGFMILYRHDRKGIHDMFTKTKVINI